ncbi:MAG: M50 family metallopeptidase [Alphaproteobacteria bacterium]
MSLIFSTVIFLTSFLAILSFLVFFHELGHYSVARFFNVAVERFSIGFGKPIARWKGKSGTEWVFGRLPIGGYVKFLGDARAASNPDTSQLEAIKDNLETEYGGDVVSECFHFKPLWQRTLIVLAGPITNLVLAIVIFGFLALLYGRTEPHSVVTGVSPGGAAEAAGVLAGDKFLTLDRHDVKERSDFVAYVSLRSDETMTAEVLRDGEIVILEITPRRMERKDWLGGVSAIGTAGVYVGSRTEVTEYSYNPLTALGYGTEQVGQTIAMTGTYVKRLFQGRENGKALGGPGRIATMTGKTAVDISKMDVPFADKMKILFRTLLYLSAAISVGLGVANLMPIPALDGGHLLYYGYEALAGRPLSEKKQEFGFRIGFALLLTALVFLTINDISYVRSMFS